MTRDDLIDLISEVTTLLGTALAQHVDLAEGIPQQQGSGIEAQKLKLDALKAKMADQRLKLAKLKDAAKRKKELIRANQHRPAAN
jgi:hypothetical protein